MASTRSGWRGRSRRGAAGSSRADGSGHPLAGFGAGIAQLLDDGRLVAYCKLGPPYLPAPDDGRSKCELRQLYILEGWKGRGIGVHMMDWAMDWAAASGCEDMYLSVFSENLRAQRLYERYGFESLGAFTIGGNAPDAFQSWCMRRG